MELMMTDSLYQTENSVLLTERRKKQIRNARARRRLEQLREAKDLERQLVDVWDNTSSTDGSESK